MSDHQHIEVSLAVSCCDPSEVPGIVETLGRVMSGLALGGHDARLNVWRFETEDEVAEP